MVQGRSRMTDSLEIENEKIPYADTKINKKTNKTKRLVLTY